MRKIVNMRAWRYFGVSWGFSTTGIETSIVCEIVQSFTDLILCRELVGDAAIPTVANHSARFPRSFECVIRRSW